MPSINTRNNHPAPSAAYFGCVLALEKHKGCGSKAAVRIRASRFIACRSSWANGHCCQPEGFRPHIRADFVWRPLGHNRKGLHPAPQLDQMNFERPPNVHNQSGPSYTHVQKCDDHGRRISAHSVGQKRTRYGFLGISRVQQQTWPWKSPREP